LRLNAEQRRTRVVQGSAGTFDLSGIEVSVAYDDRIGQWPSCGSVVPPAQGRPGTGSELLKPVQLHEPRQPPSRFDVVFEFLVEVQRRVANR